MPFLQTEARNDSLERALHRLLPWFLLLIFMTTCVAACNGYLEHNSWKMGDWLSNYQGGWIRRGLSGEIIYRFARLTHINPGVYVLLLQLLCYAVFFLFSWRLLKKQSSLSPYLLLIFSPFIFTFQINDVQGGFRKEILYFAVLAVCAWSAVVCKPKVFEKLFYLLLLFYPVLILSHEMLALFLPYLLVVYLSVFSLTRKRAVLLLAFLLPSVASFLFCLYYSGNSSQVTAIFDSLAKADYPIKGGAIVWLDKTASFGMKKVGNLIVKKHYFFYYSQIVLLAMIAYIPIRRKFGFIFRDRRASALCLASLCGSLLLFVVALDWGRFIYIHLVTWFLLSLVPGAQENVCEQPKEQCTGHPRSALALLIIYLLCWHIPHCCSPFPYAESFKELNVSALVWPYLKLF